MPSRVLSCFGTTQEEMRGCVHIVLRLLENFSGVMQLSFLDITGVAAAFLLIKGTFLIRPTEQLIEKEDYIEEMFFGTLEIRAFNLMKVRRLLST